MIIIIIKNTQIKIEIKKKNLNLLFKIIKKILKYCLIIYK